MTPATRSLATRVLAVVNVTVLVFAVSMAGAGHFASAALRPTVAEMVLDGSARISGPEGRTMVTSGDHRLHRDDVVDVLSGTAVLELLDGGSIELRGDRSGDGSRLALTEVPSLLAGAALVISGDDRPVAIEAGGARLTLTDGAARVSRSTGATFAVYTGDAAVSSGGRTLAGGLPALRQVVVPAAGKLPMAPSPLSFGTVPDPWDRRFLGDAIDLQSTLDGRSAAFTASVRNDIPVDVFFLQGVLPGLLLEPAFDQALLDEERRPVGETLVGAAVALVSDGPDFDDRWREVFALREQGAGWGLVALEVGAQREPLLRALDEAVNRSPLILGGRSPSPVFQPRLPPPRPPRAAVAPPASVPVSRRSPASTPPPPPVPTAPASPAPTPAPTEESETVLEPVVDPLVNLLDDVLEELDDLTGGLL